MHRSTGLAALLALAGSWLAWAGVSGQDSPLCRTNALANPSFEDGYGMRAGPSEIVATDWIPWYNNVPGVDGYNYVPEYRLVGARRGSGERVRSGMWSQALGTDSATHTAGVYQQVAVPIGQLVRASGWVYVWSSQADDPQQSSGPGEYQVSIGIDPFGGVNALGASVIWSAPVQYYDRWALLSVQAQAQEYVVTVFTLAAPRLRVKHNVSYWDDICLELLGWPTNTPAPTQTGQPRRFIPFATPAGPPTQFVLNTPGAGPRLPADPAVFALVTPPIFLETPEVPSPTAQRTPARSPPNVQLASLACLALLTGAAGVLYGLRTTMGEVGPFHRTGRRGQ
jgi:hypothetical protein